MAGDVTLTASMRANLYSLQQTAQLMGTVQSRLATGKKVNSALDNPNNYFSAQALSNRAADIGSLLDGMGQAIQTIKAASQGIESAQKIVDQMKAVANSALQATASSNAQSDTVLLQRSMLGTEGGDAYTTAATDAKTVGLIGLHSHTGTQTVTTNTDMNIQNGDTMTVQLGASGNTYTFTVGASNANNGAVGNGGGSTLDDLFTWMASLDVDMTLGATGLATATNNSGGAVTIAGQLATTLGLDNASIAAAGTETNGGVYWVTRTTSSLQEASNSTQLWQLSNADGTLLGAGDGSSYMNATSDLVIGTETFNLSATTTVGELVSMINAKSSTTGVTATFTTGAGNGINLTNTTGSAVAVSGSARGIFGGTGAVTTIAANNDLTAVRLYVGFGTTANTDPVLANIGVTNGQPRIATGDVLYITNGGTTSVYTVAGGDSVNDLLTAVNSMSGLSATYNTNTGKLEIESTSGQALSFSGEVAAKLGMQNATAGSASVGSSLTSQFDTLRTQLDQLVKDASYQGNNLIAGSGASPLTVVFNEAATGANKLVINAVDLTTTGLNIDAAKGSWNSTAAIQSTISALTNAKETLRQQASNLGTNLTTVQTRQDFATNMIATLKEGAEKLTLADMNEEGANMLALQTRSQLGTQSLSLASQANQAVMRLFG